MERIERGWLGKMRRKEIEEEKEEDDCEKFNSVPISISKSSQVYFLQQIRSLVLLILLPFTYAP